MHTRASRSLSGVLSASRKLRSQIASELPLDNQPSVVVADAADDDSLRALASRSRAVVSVVGPYARLGTPLVQACVACGAHYVDINGETPWVRGVIDDLHGAAMSAGVRIVPNCGYSVLSDLGVLFTVRAVRRAFGTPARAVSSLVHFNGRLSGGTLATGIALDRLPASVQVERRDPFYSAARRPAGHGPRTRIRPPRDTRRRSALGRRRSGWRPSQRASFAGRSACCARRRWTAVRRRFCVP